ncbi:phenylacetate--CoA ligase family protein [Brevibacillus dissolubilis]|uniref:phenylacetate--CoA ligase family protein n=1 Tax=Brevibacillus dissolubilis TaxID=1844116 RepID=UPI001115C5BC|nr:phenylacetate--CoA ligase family protein [Brevibacillus dissolubilis]
MMRATSTTHPQVISSEKAVARLLNLARQAQEQVPFYQKSFNGIDFTSPLTALTDLPFLTKDQVRAAQQDIVKQGMIDHPDTVLEYTSGSTGIPLKLVRSRTELMKGAKSLWRSRAQFFPDVMFTPGVQVSASELIQQEAKTDQTIILSAFDLRPDRVEQYLDQIDYHKPAWLRGHPAILAVLAEGMRRVNRRFTHKLVFVESNSGWLQDETRDLLAEMFDCPIANHYGTRETYTIAYECPHGTMHLQDDMVVAELHTREEGIGHELVVSSQIFETMPFIRYRVGDLVESGTGQCACGSSAPELRPFGGRSNELIEGTVLVGTYVFHVLVTKILKAGYDIMQYQVYQTGLDTFDVQLVLADPTSLQGIADRFVKEAASILPNASFSFQAVDHIEPTRGGKVQVFVKCL